MRFEKVGDAARDAAARSGVGASGGARLATPLGLAIRKFGNAVPLAVIHACNTVTPDRLADLKLRLHRAEVKRMADESRRQREDAEALRIDMGEWWDEVSR